MGKNPENHDRDWTEEDNQYIVKHYMQDGIAATAKALKRKRESVKAQIRKLAREGYFENLFKNISKEELIEYVMQIQDIHYELLSNLNDREDQTRAMIDQNLELHHVLYKDMLHKLRNLEAIKEFKPNKIA